MDVVDRKTNVRLVRAAVAACGAISRLASTSTKQATPETSETLGQARQPTEDVVINLSRLIHQ